ncbi:mismatch-specific DNA-glycosylase [Brachybacterium sp. DNPG3]
MSTGPRRPSPLGGERPTRADLQRFAVPDPDAIDDVLPGPGDPPLRLLMVGINPGLWTAAVNAPFAHPGNRFWPSLHRAGLTSRRVDASRGLDPVDEADLHARGLGVTNLIGRATARADELSREELREAGALLPPRVAALRPAVVAIVGITAFRTAFGRPKARLGRQERGEIAPWPEDTVLWVVPQPSGLNAHATVDTLAATWREVAADAGIVPDPPASAGPDAP